MGRLRALVSRGPRSSILDGMTWVARIALPLLCSCVPSAPSAEPPALRASAAPPTAVAPAGEVAAELLLDLDEVIPTTLAIGGGYLYWTHWHDHHGSAWRMRTSGGAPEQLAAELKGGSYCMLEGDELWISAD